MEPTPLPDDPNLRAFDALIRDVVPRTSPGELDRQIVELEDMVAELRDLIQQMRGTLAELRDLRGKREAYKLWH